MRSSISTLPFALMLTACASHAGTADPNAPGSTDAQAIATSFYALTVVDCHKQVRSCLDANHEATPGAARLLGLAECTEQLAECSASAALDSAPTVLDQATVVTGCAHAGLDCTKAATSSKEVLRCENAVEKCAADAIAAVTGIALPTLQEVVADPGAAVGAAGEALVDTATTATQTAGDAVVDTAVGATDAAHEVAEAVAPVPAVVADTALSAGLAAGITAVKVSAVVVDAVEQGLTCAASSATCWHTTFDFVGCLGAYNACILH